jgi:hypothetical protein
MPRTQSSVEGRLGQLKLGGEIMRRLLRDTAENREPGDITTLADPSVMERVQRASTRAANS